LDTLTNRYSRRFTLIVIAVAIGAGVFWTTAGDAARGLKAFISVLIVACPCALALAAPFTFGTAQRLLARMQVFLKNALVLERMAQVDAIVFDKTGTLTCGNAEGRMQNAEMGRLDRGDPSIKSAAAEMGLSDAEAEWVCAVAGNSTHPLAVRVGQALAGAAGGPCVEAFKEIPGCGVEGRVQGHEIRLGSRAWLENCSIPVSLADGGRPGPSPGPQGSSVCLAVDGRFRGTFVLANAVRPETGELLHGLGERYSLALLSGDNEKERERFRELFGGNAALHFNQSPLDKLGFIHGLQVSGRRVMMVGDGLNDAGALKQSDVGVAVVEQAGAFSPASDVILEAGRVPRLSRVLALARTTMQIVRLSFGISAAYNLAGISIAAAGILSPVICAVLMPVSSISVVLFACGATNLAAKRAGLTE
jgi:Cu+-exporting ATPase